MGLTKTLFVQGKRCPKLLYYSVNKKQDIPKDSLGVEFRKIQGIKVGDLAKELYPEGVDLAKYPDPTKLKLTEENRGKIVFEASVQFEDLFARADILKPNDDGTFDILEVKSDTQVKPEHIPDVAFQRYVFEKSGYKINECYVVHTNNEYVKQGDIDVKQLFIEENVSELIDAYGKDDFEYRVKGSVLKQIKNGKN